MRKKNVTAGPGSRNKSVIDLFLLQNEYDLITFFDDVYPEISKVWSLPVPLTNIGKIVDCHEDTDDFAHLCLRDSMAGETR